MFSRLSYIFSVLFLGSFFAALFYKPVMKVQSFYEKNITYFTKHRKSSNVLSILTWYVAVAAFLFFVIFLFYNNILSYFCRVSWDEFIEKMTSSIYHIIDTLPFFRNQKMKLKCINMIYHAMDQVIPLALEFLARLFLKLPKILTRLAVSIIISIYLLLDRQQYFDGINHWKQKHLTLSQREMADLIFEESKNSFLGYWKGQSLDAIIMGSLISIGLLLFRVPLSFSIGILSGIGNLIPYVGPVIAFSLTSFFCMIKGEMKTFMISILYLIVIGQIDASYIGPKLLGKQVNVRPLSVLIAVLIGGTLFGTIGMIFAVPFISILKTMIMILRKKSFS